HLIWLLPASLAPQVLETNGRPRDRALREARRRASELLCMGCRFLLSSQDGLSHTARSFPASALWDKNLCPVAAAQCPQTACSRQEGRSGRRLSTDNAAIFYL